MSSLCLKIATADRPWQPLPILISPPGNDLRRLPAKFLIEATVQPEAAFAGDAMRTVSLTADV